MLRKPVVFLAIALAMGAAAVSSSAWSRDIGGNNGPHGGEVFIPPGGGGDHFGGSNDRNFGGSRGFGAREFRNDRRWNWRHRRNNDDFGFGLNFGVYGDDCYQTVRYHTRKGWRWRHVYVC
jgi:hypothetical protein